MTKLEKEVFDYLKQIEFNDVDISLVKMYINMCTKVGWKDALGIIDEHEIKHIRSLMKQYGTKEMKSIL